MRLTRRSIFAATLLALFLLCGCSKKPETAPNSDNGSSTAQSAAADTADSNASYPAPAGSASDAVASGAPASGQKTWERIPAGTPITVRLQQRLSSVSAVRGERFEAVIDEPVVADNRIVVPVGAVATGHVVVARHSGRLHHPGQLGLTLDSVSVGQQVIPLVTSNVVARGGSHKKRNLAWIGGSTGGGALIGALAAGGKGALIGSGIGAAAGTTTAFITGKKDVALGSERQLRFRLNRDVNVSG